MSQWCVKLAKLVSLTNIKFENLVQFVKTNKEIELTDAIRAYINSGEKVYASFLKGECFDCGNKEGYFKSILKTGLERPEFRKEITKLVKNL